MSSTGNTANKPDAATLALWRAAEAGKLDEVEAIVPRVADLNARNEHGVTALMRAAQHGHAWVVRLLLAKGADANVIRNDKFTALSLAAFFGHTEVVRALMEHGADSQAATRSGTSPHMWAIARTFSEVVDQLESPAPPQREERAVPTPAAPARAAPMAAARVRAPVTSAIVRTLKDPPEIWDLVHEAPKGFNARATFVARLRSMRLTLRAAAAAILVGACVMGVLLLRGVHAGNELTAERQIPAAPVVEVKKEEKTFENSVQPAVTQPPATIPDAIPDTVAPSAAPVTTEEVKTPSTRRRNSHSRVVSSFVVQSQPAESPAATESVQRIETSPEKSEVKARAVSTPRTPASSPLSPHLIAPAKNASSPKSKVIQWP